jgi:mannose-1-phosphate guanylyltransferase
VVVASMDGRPVVALGVKDLVIVSHEDAVYVLDKQKAGDVVALEQLRTMLGDTRKDLL